MNELAISQYFSKVMSQTEIQHSDLVNPYIKQDLRDNIELSLADTSSSLVFEKLLDQLREKGH